MAMIGWNENQTSNFEIKTSFSNKQIPNLGQIKVKNVTYEFDSTELFAKHRKIHS